MAAADIGDLGTAFELGLDSLERRNPRLDEVRQIAAAIEALAAVEDLVVMLRPADGRGAVVFPIQSTPLART